MELGAGSAIAYAGKLSADLGADVTRIEVGGWESASGEERADSEANGLTLYLNSRKKSIIADPSADAGRAAMSKLLARSRVLFHGANDRCFAERGLSPETIAQEFPGLIVVSVTPFGLTGDARAWPADDLTLQAFGGISIGIGLPGRPPLKLPGDQSGFQAGLSAAIAAMGALFSERGMLIDVSAADVWASFYTGVEVALANFGRHRKRRAGHRVSGQPYPRTIYRCKDGYFAIQCGESRHWQSFLGMIGREDLATHPLFANRFEANDGHGDECDALIEPWFLSRTKDEILQQCLEHKIPGAPVYDIREVVEHPHLRGRGYFVDVDAQRGRMRFPGDPYAGLTRPASHAQAASPAASALRRPGIRPPASRHVAGGAIDRKERPLTGVRVVDFGWVWAGAVPGHILADMGAEVIKVESASPLDYMRQGRPIIGTRKDPEQNPMFHNVNRGKLSLRIDLNHAEAKDVLKDLVAVSDVVIENFSPGVMAKFGLSYADLRAVRPDMVMCSMSAVGQNGPLRGIRTYATMIASLAGLDSLVGYPGERVLGSQSSYADPNASLHATFGILAALWRRESTGVGAYIDLSQWEAAVNVMGKQVTDYILHGRAPATCGTLHETKVPHGNYPAAGDDRWIAISIADDAQWQALKRSLSDPEWMSLEKFATVRERHANRAELDERLARETRKHEPGTLASALLAGGVPAAPLLDARGIANHMLFRERALFEMVEHPVLKSVPVYRVPWQVNGAPVTVTRRAPLLGEHNAYVLQTLLGYSRERLKSLHDAGVFR
ncbi:MAG: CoA transferase [Betaproteobacteria bacterium]|nr:CoA transferase [Betaproteobacteria bacterium]